MTELPEADGAARPVSGAVGPPAGAGAVAGTPAGAGTGGAAATGPAPASPAPAPHPLYYLYPVTFLSGTIIISLGPVLDPILRDLQLPLSQGGLLAAGFAAGRVVGLLVLNLFLARVSLKRMVVGATLLQAVGLALAATADSLLPLVLLLALVGGAATIPVIVPPTWIGAYAKQSAERAMMLILIFFALGVLATPLAIGAALSLGAHWRWIFAGEAVFALVIALAFIAVPLADVRERENLRWRHVRELASVDPRLLGLIVLAMFLYIGAEHIFNIWLAEFQVQSFGTSQGVAAVALALFFAGMMAGRYLAVPLTRRIAGARMLAISGGLMAVFALLVAFSPSLLLSEVFIFLAGLGGSVSYPLISSYINRFPVKFAAPVSSLLTLVVVVSGAIFAYLIGPAAEALGMRWALALAAAPAAAVAVLAFFLPRSRAQA